MCGILGKLTFDGSPVQKDQLCAMAATLAHRGPDANGFYCNGHVGLAHTRLSIVDLQGGSQPMSTADGCVSIVFNGEIFNYIELRKELFEKGYRFSTNSDTEVILNAYREYGEECVYRFNGQWAFCIWDASEQKLFLSRDRMGILPLYYTQGTHSFLFASEIKALLASGQVDPELDLTALNQTFTFWVPLPPRTAFKNIQQLAPGKSLTVKNGEVRLRQYFDLEYPAKEEFSDENEAEKAEELLGLLKDATRLRLRADVPVAAYLSGGIDSTVTAALAKSFAGDGLKTFSIAFDDEEFDESSYQNEASDFLHTAHSSLRCSLADISRVFPEVVRHAEQPILRSGPAPLYLLAELVRKSGYKVVLTGEGADEVLGGYDLFKEAKIRRFWGVQPGSRWRPLLLKRLYPYIPGIRRQPAIYLKNFFDVDADELSNPFFSHLPRWRLTASLKSFFSADVRASLQDEDPLRQLERLLPRRFFEWAHFNQAEYLETKYLLPGYILSSQGERMAMANSVECRYPYLDHRVVQFASRLSPKSKMKVLQQKHLLKRATWGLIPQSISDRPKQPYRAPDGKCFLGSATPEYAKRLLSDEAIRSNGVFDPDAVNGLVRKFSRGQALGVRDNMALIGILSTQLLLDCFSSTNFGGPRWKSQKEYAGLS
jgi:asparagine synthase (glutamine-hydrolysing)